MELFFLLYFKSFFVFGFLDLLLVLKTPLIVVKTINVYQRAVVVLRFSNLCKRTERVEHWQGRSNGDKA